MLLTLDFPIQIGHTFRTKMINNFRTILNYYNELDHQHRAHTETKHHAHQAMQVDYRNTNVSAFLDYLNGNINGLVLGANGDGIAETKQARVSIDGTVHPLLQERLLHDFLGINRKLDKEIHSNGAVDFIWNPPYIAGNRLGENGTPNNWDPEAHIEAFLNPLVDNQYVTKEVVGEDTSGKYNVYKFTFEPQNYNKTLLITSCIHGNETTGFFDMCHILNLLVNQWEKYPQLTYLRKNVRLIYVPMVNPWGFANQKRENVNNVDLNRNFDYNWKAGKGTDPDKSNFKGKSPFSEKESQNMRSLVQRIDNLTAHLDLHDIISVNNDYCLFYPRWANQKNNNMTHLINNLKSNGDLVVWGSSTLSSFSNWVGIRNKTTSYLSEINEKRVGEKKSPEEMRRSVRWVGNVIFRMAQFESYQNGQTSLDPFIKVMIYDDRFNNKTSEVITLRAERNEWQRIMMSQQRFKVLANGFVELYGYVTINVDRDVTVGISPNIVQNYHPFFGFNKSRKRNLFSIEHRLNKGNTTFPIYAAAGVQMSTITEPGTKRTDTVMPVLDVKKKGAGIVTIKQIKLFAKFTPTHSANSIQILKSGEYGNLKEDTFTQIYPNTMYDDDLRNVINREEK